MKLDRNGKEISDELLKELKKDWEYEHSEDITYMKYDGKTFEDFIKTIDVNDYYDDEEFCQ